MKITITKCYNRIKLIKFFRSYKQSITLNEAVYNVDNLPYIFEYLSKWDANDIRDKIKDCTSFLMEDEAHDVENMSFCFNSNINPPQEYVDALAWYESCSEEHKSHIDQIVLWRNRPAVC